LTDAEVVDGPDVEAAQLEHQVHLGGPAADAAYGYEPGDQFLVAAFGCPREHDCSVEDLGAKVAERGEFVRGQADRAECRVGCCGHRRGRQRLADCRSQPAVDCPCGWSCELLVDDRADERAEGAVRVAWAMGDRSDAGDEPSEHGIARGNLADRGLERCARHG
jgi:hypothetical protein